MVLTLTLGEAAYFACRVIQRDDERVRGMEEIGIGEFARRSRLSVKALRLYDELGVLIPARVDGSSGYRYYDVAQLDDARLVAMLRQLEFPLASVKELVASDPLDAAERIALHWRDAESLHDAQRDLADYLVNKLRGKRSPMYEVATREIPERSVLCLKRNVDEQGAWALGKEFIAILRERPLPKMEGREGAMFSIYWGEVSADGDGPVEWCKPVPTDGAKALASKYPELSLRTEPAHREAYVALADDAIPAGPGGNPGVQWQLASEALRAWADEQGVIDKKLDLTPGDLGIRITYVASVLPVTETSDPYCDFAVPFAPANS
jgi:DNA-binding transcriptional MerR regulator